MTASARCCEEESMSRPTPGSRRASTSQREIMRLASSTIPRARSPSTERGGLQVELKYKNKGTNKGAIGLTNLKLKDADGNVICGFGA